MGEGFYKLILVFAVLIPIQNNMNSNNTNTRNTNARRGKRAYIASGTVSRPSGPRTLASAFEASNHRLFAPPTSGGFTEAVGRKAAPKAKIAASKTQDVVSVPNRFDKPVEQEVQVNPVSAPAPLRGAWAAGRPKEVKPHQEVRPKPSQAERKREVAAALERTAKEKALSERLAKNGMSLWADEE